MMTAAPLLARRDRKLLRFDAFKREFVHDFAAQEKYRRVELVCAEIMA